MPKDASRRPSAAIKVYITRRGCRDEEHIPCPRLITHSIVALVSNLWLPPGVCADNESEIRESSCRFRTPSGPSQFEPRLLTVFAAVGVGCRQVEVVWWVGDSDSDVLALDFMLRFVRRLRCEVSDFVVCGIRQFE